MKLLFLLFLLLVLISMISCFQLISNQINNNNYKRMIVMRWSFQQRSGIMPSSIEINSNVGLEGEYYYTPTKIAKLKPPVGKNDILGKERIIPIFPAPNVLVPGGNDWLNIFEMKHRLLLNNVGDTGGVFGFSYLSTTQQKLALVGTLARITSRKILEDGRSFVVVEGLERFYIQEIIADKPYLKAKIITFKDYTEQPNILDELENKIFNEVRCNVKLMEILFPQKNYTLNPHILLHRPHLQKAGVRNVITDDTMELSRRSKFSFAVMDMLQISPATKISLLQEHNLEKRYSRFLKVLEKGGSYLKDELRNRGVLTEPGIKALCDEVLNDEIEIPKQSWVAENYVNGAWIPMATIM